MNSVAHRAIAEYAGERCSSMKPADLENFVLGSTLPDECDDIMVKVGDIWKTRFGPYALCSLTHFAGVSEGRIHGYCFGHDRAVVKIGLRIGKVRCRLPLVGPSVAGWRKVTHPLEELLQIEGVKSKKLSTITFPSSAAMCRYYERLMQAAPSSSGARFQLLGCAAHMAMDACVPQHVTCTLGEGHSSFEGSIDDLLRSEGTAVLKEAWKEVEQGGIKRYDFDDLYSMIQFAAERTLAAGYSVTPYKALANGLGWTVSLLRHFWRKAG